MTRSRSPRPSHRTKPAVAPHGKRQTTILDRWPNFRDLNSAATETEHHIRPGRFFRGPALTDLSAAEQEMLVSMDPAVVIDFRSEAEVDALPVALPESLSARRLHLPLPPLVDDRMDRRFRKPGVAHEEVSAAIADNYRELIRVHDHIYRRFLQVIADVGDRPVIFHCTAGKDRTGLAAALILAALDAPPEAVERDYLATSELWWPDPELESLVPVAVRPAVFGVAQAYLDAALWELAVRHGGPVSFAERAMGGPAYRAWKERHRMPRPERACARTSQRSSFYRREPHATYRPGEQSE